MDKMKFEEFSQAVVEKIREFLPDGFAKAEVELQTVTKNNDLKLTGLVIRSVESNISPTIYLESFFEKHQAGEDICEILASIADTRVKHEVSEKFDVESILDFGKVREKIVPRLIGREWNRSLLEERPHTDVADLAVTYHISLKDELDESASIPVSNQMMREWGVTVEDLHEVALTNLPVLRPCTIESMSDILASMMGGSFGEDMLTPQDEVMFVISNENRVFGSASVLDEKFMKGVVDTFGNRNFYLLPSSVHEWILVSSSDDCDISSLKEIIMTVNATDVRQEERLSESVYTYSLENGLVIAY